MQAWKGGSELKCFRNTGSDPQNDSLGPGRLQQHRELGGLWCLGALCHWVLISVNPSPLGQAFPAGLKGVSSLARGVTWAKIYLWFSFCVGNCDFHPELPNGFMAWSHFSNFSI